MGIWGFLHSEGTVGWGKNVYYLFWWAFGRISGGLKYGVFGKVGWVGAVGVVFGVLAMSSS